MSYDAMGRQISQSNGVATSTFAYNSGNLQIDAETIAYDFNADNTIDFARVIDRSQDHLGRDIGYSLKTENSELETSSSYGFSTLHGRLTSVTGPSNDAHIYAYLPNSNLITSVTSASHVVANVWEANRNVLVSKENKVGSTVVSKYEYSVNHLGQRTNVSQTGSAFAASRSIAWGYNSKGEVVKADHSDTAQSRAYQYDGIGNRLSGGGLNPPSQTTYTATALNQYSAIGSISPSYDDDGNATAYPLPANVSANSSLVWDGENRLIQAQVSGGNTVSYVYDSQSRRIAETVGSAATVYIYDGWNPIAEYWRAGLQPATLTKTYLWGMDLSGSMQGAGGVGGLLAVNDGSGIYYPTYDGNGNVSEYLDSSGNIEAHYEYDPFGKTTVTGGSKASDFAHRFSTKPLDSTTGLFYYGYRFYDPETGRWPSRDPIEEEGGVNLYAFVVNNGVNAWDYAGLTPSPGELLALGGSIRRYADNRIIKWLGWGGILLQAAFFLEDAYEIFIADIPECFCSSLAPGVWIGERESSTRSLLGNAAGVLTGVIGGATGPVASKAINLIISPVVNYIVNKFTPDPFVRKIAKTSSPPPVLQDCKDPLGLSYER